MTVHTLWRHVRGGVGIPPGQVSDGQLLERFLARRDEAAFEALVYRHGPMVLGVCRRLLRHTQDVEDAFQATFVVLVRKAHAVVPRENVANWLYGVAYRTAQRARADAARRRAREREASEMPEIEAAGRDVWADLEPLLDRELSRLPDAYRVAIVLCELEGKTRKEAARQLGWAEGTVASRLARGRALLAERLGRCGLAVSGGLLTAVVAERATAGLPPTLVGATVRAGLACTGSAAAGALPANVAALSRGVLRTMLLSKLKIATAVLVACAALAAGGVVLTQRVRADKPADPPAAPARAETPADKPAVAVKPPAAAAPETKAAAPLPVFIRGVAKAVDVDKRTLTVEHDAGETTFAVTAGAPIEIDHKPSEFARLPKGANVIVSRLVDATTAGHVQANGRSYYGNRVTAVDVTKNTLTIKDRDDEKTFPVRDDAFINVDGKGAKLSAIPPGAFVNLELSADQQTAYLIGADGEDLGGCGGSCVAAIDTALSTITFDAKAMPRVAGKTFAVARDANITIDGKPGSLAALPVGAYVNALLRVDGTTVRQINAQGPSNLCDCGGSMVAAVDVEKGTVTFDAKARAEVAGKTFRLAKDANITIDGKPGVLAALPVGSYVDIRLQTDGQTVGQLSATGQSNVCDCGGSLVTAVDAEKSTITFDAGCRPEVAGQTFPVAKDAIVVIDGKSGKLTDLPAGSYVDLRLRVDRQTAGMVYAYGPAVPGTGVVKAVDAEKGTITVDDKTYPVAKGANITVDGKTVNLTGVPPGIHVTMRLCVDQKTVGSIFHAKAP